MSHRYCIRGAIAALALTLFVSGASGLAAQTGSVTGVVTDATTGQPLDGARVSLAGTRISALTGSGGRYLLGGVPAGTQTVKVVIIGYGTREREVTVTPGSTLEADFRLEVSGVDLDQPVTAGAGPSERPEDRHFAAGHRLRQDFGILPGGRLQPRPRRTHSRRPLQRDQRGDRLRAANSASAAPTRSEYTRQRPLVLIDGVRVDTEKLEWGGMEGVTCCAFLRRRG